MEKYINISQIILYLYVMGFDCEHLRKLGGVGPLTVNRWLDGHKRHRSTGTFFLKNIKRNLLQIVAEIERFEREIENDKS